MAEKEYQRLTRARLRRTGALAAFATRSSLWLAKDHLLGVDSSGGYAEEYKRFYFRDIQAVTLRKTSRRLWFNIVLGGFALVFLIITFAVVSPPGNWDSGEMAGAIFLLGMVSFFGLLMLINTLKGPGCVCHLRTAVQTEAMPSLNRLGRARKVLNRIRPLIEAAQGSLSPEEIASNLANPHLQNAPPVIGRYKAVPVAVPPRYYGGTAHLVLFWLLLADVPLTAVSIVYDSDWTDLASVLLLLVTVGYAITSLVKQRNTTLPAALKRLSWMVLAWDALMVVTAIVYGIVLVISNPEALDRSLSALDDPVVLVMTVITTTGTAVLGFVGLVLLRRFRAASLMPVPEAPVAGGGQSGD